jgi:hypothetical protein
MVTSPAATAATVTMGDVESDTTSGALNDHSAPDTDAPEESRSSRR